MIDELSMTPVVLAKMMIVLLPLTAGVVGDGSFTTPLIAVPEMAAVEAAS